MSLGDSIAGGNPQYGRVENDFYETEEAATHAIMRFLKRHWSLRDLLIWENACGKGAMSKVMALYEPLGIISTDLVERGFGTGGVDFLQVDALPRTSKGVYDTIITNPPFELTPDFFSHAVALGVQRMVFLMKAQYWHSNWQKPPKTSMMMWNGWTPSFWCPNTWRLNFHNVETGYEGKKASSTMDTAWCVWDRHAKHQGCLTVPLIKPIGY